MTGVRLEPSTSTVKIWNLPLEPLFEENAMRCPSGDQAGASLIARSCTMRCAAERSAFTTPMYLGPIAGPTACASWVPSGDHEEASMPVVADDRPRVRSIGIHDHKLAGGFTVHVDGPVIRDP